jgi:hypothetical protein
VKLEQLYNQLVLDIKNGVLLYDTRQYKSLCSVYLALKNITGKVSLDNCLDLIPAGILKSAKKDHFIKEVSETLHKLEMFFSENSSFKKFRIGQLAFQKIAARSAFYGMKLFQVEFPKDFHMIFEGHYLLGVNYQGLSVIDRKSREVLESVDWTTINRMNVFCNLLMVDRKDSLSLKMICQSGFLLKGLADDYKFY